MTEIDKKKADSAYISNLIEPENSNTDMYGANNQASKRASIRRPNIPMITMIFVLLIFGSVVLYSVSGPDAYGKFGDSAYFLRKQLRFTIIGLVLCFAVARIPLSFFKNKIIVALSYITSIGLAFVTLAFGSGAKEHGASRWISIGGFQFQTSEVIKVALIIAFAGYRVFVDDLHKKGKLKAKNPARQMLLDAAFDFIIPVVAAVIVDGIIVLQPHVSCFIIIGVVIFMCAVSSEIPGKSWLTGSLIVALVAVVFGLGALMIAPAEKRESFMNNYAHVFKRLEIFSSDDETTTDEETTLTEDDTRQVDNAFNALGSGGMWGVGLGNSRSKYNYVSEAQNDYIFSIYVEETGFVGGVVLIMLYLVLFGMCINVVWRADGIFSRTVAAGCTTLIFIEVFLNMAVELQVIPSTGVTLPFISYGGTAQVCLLVAYGFILSVARQGTVPIEPKKMKRSK